MARQCALRLGSMSSCGESMYLAASHISVPDQALDVLGELGRRESIGRVRAFDRVEVFSWCLTHLA